MIAVAPGVGDAAAPRDRGEHQNDEKNAIHGGVASRDE